jgi:hypothetical protein
MVNLEAVNKWSYVFWMYHNYNFCIILLSSHLIQPTKFHDNMMWFMNVNSRVKVIFIFIFWIVLFHLISLHFYILRYNIINFTIPKEYFLNFETE